MKIEIFLDDEYADILKEQPSLIAEFQRAATLVVMNALEKKRRVETYLQGSTINGHLDCGVIEPLGKPEPDALQTFVEANRRDDKAIGIRNTEVERLLEEIK